MTLRLAEDSVEAQLGELVRREMPVRPSTKPFTHRARWVAVQTDQGLNRALPFGVRHKGSHYMGRLSPV